MLGFSFVFVSLGTLLGAVGDWLFAYQRPITIGLGVLVIALGLVFLGVVPWMQRDWRIHKVPSVGLAAAPLLGILFGLGWAPCLGPTLTAVTALAMNEGTAVRGAFLSLVLLPGPRACRSSSPRWPTAGCSAPSGGYAGTSAG